MAGMGRLKADIKQSRPFRALEEEVFLNLLRTTDALQRAEAELLKTAGLSSAQYNVLRILRGAGADGLRCAEVSHRMVTRDPDVTRLLDRLEARALIRRARDEEDRRVVTTRITEAGVKLIAGLDEPLADLHRRQLGHLNAASLRALNDLLERARERVE
jgi:DNA-binding MarR family transcriptional regulator